MPKNIEEILESYEAEVYMKVNIINNKYTNER